MSDALAALSRAGVSLWLHDLSRERLASGHLADLVARACITGVAANPGVVAAAISGGDAYDAQLRDLAARGISVQEALRALTTFDARWACDVLRPVYEASGGADGRVSVEVDPRLAHDAAATIAEARALWWLIDRPNLLIKIPAARQGLTATAGCLAAGISVNVTLVFSLQRYAEVTDAFLDGMERARQAGHNLSSMASVASFFVSRLNTEMDARLDKLGTAASAALRGRAAIANARLAYQHYEQVFCGPRWTALREARARPQRPVWVSTSVKDPAYPATRYVTGLVAPGVVHTMPEATLRLVTRCGELTADSVRPYYADAAQVLDQVRAAGVDYDDVMQTLEDRGAAAFDTAWAQLGEQLAVTLHGAPGPAGRVGRAAGRVGRLTGPAAPLGGNLKPI